MSLDGIFRSVFVLNLPSRADKLNSFLVAAKPYFSNVKVFSAWNGLSNETPNECKKYCQGIGSNTNICLAEIGCAISHFKLWELVRALETDKYVLILEDDAVATPTVKREDVVNTLEHVSDGIPVVYFGYTSARVSQTLAHHSLGTALCTHAYALNSNGAKTLLQHFSNIVLQRPIDVTLRDSGFVFALVSNQCIEKLQQIGFGMFYQDKRALSDIDPCRYLRKQEKLRMLSKRKYRNAKSLFFFQFIKMNTLKYMCDKGVWIVVFLLLLNHEMMSSAKVSPIN